MWASTSRSRGYPSSPRRSFSICAWATRRPGRTRAWPTPRVRQATSGPFPEGCVGAGTGATVGKLFGVSQAMKSGLGSAALEVSGGVKVAALVAVNAFGDVRDPATGTLLAGARTTPESFRLANTAASMRDGVRPVGYKAENTTLAVVATNARLTKLQATKLAQTAQHGLIRAICPVHTTLDGDLVIALATGVVEAEPNTLGLAAADVVAEAIVRAVKAATSLGGLPAWRDLEGDSGS